MRKTFIATGLLAACGGLLLASAAARADVPATPQSVEYFHNGHNAPPVFPMVAFDPNDYAPIVSTGTASDANFPVEKSHGHP